MATGIPGTGDIPEPDRLDIDEDRERTCESCKKKYTIAAARLAYPTYFDRPYYYGEACESICLACHLGVKP